MMLSYGAWLFALGVLGAGNLIVAKLPATRDLIGKMAPYQGWFGAVSVFYGLGGFVQAAANMGLMTHNPPFGLVFWILFVAQALFQIALGILFGVGVIKTFVTQPQAIEKMETSSS